MSEIHKGQNAEEMRPVVKCALQSFQLDGFDSVAIWNAIWTQTIVYIVAMPVELGGGPIYVCWFKEDAERMATSRISSDLMQAENKRRESMGLEPLSEFQVIESTIDSLARIEKARKDGNDQGEA